MREGNRENAYETVEIKEETDLSALAAKVADTAIRKIGAGQVDSGKYNIHGRVDRVFDDSFSIVKGGKAPTHGVYASDRLQAVCYSICLEEMYGKEFYGRVEYLGSGTVRSVVLSPSDKRLFLTALKEVEKVRRGEIPRPIRGEKCKLCRFAENCSPLERPQTLLERLKKR
jgi:CRISPR-associated exonuclease Cas4